MKRLVIALSPLILVAVAQAQDDLPAGPGKDQVETVCTACHGPEAITAMTGTKDIWQSVVDDMKSRGAAGSDDDFKAIVNYLAKYFGPDVNVNTAPAADLADQLFLTSDEAAAIVKYRTDNGNFKAWDDLKKVPGLDIAKLEPIQKRIKFAAAADAAAPSNAPSN